MFIYMVKIYKNTIYLVTKVINFFNLEIDLRLQWSVAGGQLLECSKTCLKRPLKNRQNKDPNDKL